MAKVTVIKKAKRPGNKKIFREAPYPRHALNAILRLPRAIDENNAGHPCTDQQLAEFSGFGFHGPFKSMLGSALKYTVLERPEPGKVAISEIGRRILHPRTEDEEIQSKRDAIQAAPQFREVLNHYSGKKIPEDRFFHNTLRDDYKVPEAKMTEFTGVLFENLKSVSLLSESNGEYSVVDVDGLRSKQKGSLIEIVEGDECFVMMPFGNPVGHHYEKLFVPAIKEAGLVPRRADDGIFGSGRIMEQIWTGVERAKVLIAELTDRNPNVFYELGIAHALKKPVVLVAAQIDDVPSDLRHVRVVLYNRFDPFWGDLVKREVTRNLQLAHSDPQFVFDAHRLPQRT